MHTVALVVGVVLLTIGGVSGYWINVGSWRHRTEFERNEQYASESPDPDADSKAKRR